MTARNDSGFSFPSNRLHLERSPKSGQVGSLFGQCIVCSKLTPQESITVTRDEPVDFDGAPNRGDVNSDPLAHLCQCCSFRAIKNISSLGILRNETRMTTRSGCLGQCASTLPFRNERNFARFKKDLRGFRSREIFFDATSPRCVFSSPSYFTFSTKLVQL